MKFTNKLNLPQPIVSAITADKYSRGEADMSVTQLLKPPRMTALEWAYENELTADVSELVWAMFGTAVHNVLDNNTEHIIPGRRLYTTCRDWTISGEFDYIDADGILWDWKVASVWEIMNGVKEEREQQLNLYSLLAARNGIQINGLKLGFLLRDWSQSAADRDRQYPPFSIHVVPVANWGILQAEEYLEERVRLHQEARVNLPECTPEEQWAKPTVWAATKTGNTRATKLFPSENEALAWHQLQSDGASMNITQRPGDLTRCRLYCTVGGNGFCEQYNATKNVP